VPYSLNLSCCSLATLPISPAGEKRKLPENLTLEDAKRLRVMGDIPMELVNEVMLTITEQPSLLTREGRGSSPTPTPCSPPLFCLDKSAVSQRSPG
jgi:hypothetical protein